jgi:hypothetical protein
MSKPITRRKKGGEAAVKRELGIVYHREGIIGDYDAFQDVEALIAFIRTGLKHETSGDNHG